MESRYAPHLSRKALRVTTDSPIGSEAPKLAWSPDGSSMVYETPTGLYEAAIDGRGKIQLTGRPDSDLAPSWVAS